METTRVKFEEQQIYSTEKPRNCLLVGGHGYIGTNFQRKLESEGIEPFMVDQSRGARAEQLSVLKEIDYIVNFAAYPGVQNCKENFKMAIIDNLSVAFNVFNLAFKNGIPVIHLSSQAAGFPEESLYGTVKAAIEVEARRHNDLNGNFKLARLTNVFGGVKFERKLTVVRRFIKAVEREEPMVINGDGSQIRDFIHVDDVCDALYLMMRYPKRLYNPLDIGTGIGTSVLEIANIFKEKFGIPFTFNEQSDIIGPKESIADPTNAEKLLGFKAQRSFKEWLENLDI